MAGLGFSRRTQISVREQPAHQGLAVPLPLDHPAPYTFPLDVWPAEDTLPLQIGALCTPRSSIVSTLTGERARMRQRLERINAMAPFAIGTHHLLTPALWQTQYGGFLLHQLGLLPYGAWNTLLLPLHDDGRRATGLPVVPAADDAVGDDLMSWMGEIVRLANDESDHISDALQSILDGVKARNADLLPADQGDLPDRIGVARANVRALALCYGGTFNVEVVRLSRRTFLANPRQFAE